MANKTETVVASVTLVPPPSTRGRKSSAVPSIVASMLAKFENAWESDGQEYPNSGRASSAASIYRRALAVEVAKRDGDSEADAGIIKSRVWQVNGGGWVFALHVKED